MKTKRRRNSSLDPHPHSTHTEWLIQHGRLNSVQLSSPGCEGLQLFWVSSSSARLCLLWLFILVCLQASKGESVADWGAAASAFSARRAYPHIITTHTCAHISHTLPATHFWPTDGTFVHPPPSSCHLLTAAMPLSWSLLLLCHFLLFIYLSPSSPFAFFQRSPAALTPPVEHFASMLVHIHTCFFFFSCW